MTEGRVALGAWLAEGDRMTAISGTGDAQGKGVTYARPLLPRTAAAGPQPVAVFLSRAVMSLTRARTTRPA